MNRRDALQTTGAFALGTFFSPDALLNFSSKTKPLNYTKADFGENFIWGAATSAYQIEGAHQADGKGVSIWDTFTHTEGRIKNKEHGDTACDFYHRFEDDLALAKQINMQAFRFSTAWTRLLPQGKGQVNTKGIDFYNRLIDTCLEKGLQPWLTLYHWDLPQALEDLGGWTNRDIIGWFNDYTQLCADKFGDRVKHFMVLNEPTIFSLLGYLDGRHAPGHRDFTKFIKVVHHVAMVQAEAARTLRSVGKNLQIGTTFSCNIVQPYQDNELDKKACERLDVLFNRLYIEPALGLGYPTATVPLFKMIETVMQQGDEQKLKFDFDFIGIQNYTRIVARHDDNSPLLQAKFVEAKERGVSPLTAMNWEIYPEGMYLILKQFAQYEGVKKIIITENGAAFEDIVEKNKVNDALRIAFFEQYLAQVLRAKKEGVPVEGYLAWSLLDNFEWAEGYHPRFGLVHVDYDTQKRTLKNSALWFKKFLNK
ncbi:MAG: beta-glucosidase [Cytophagales bacterium]|nr:MAG: beta-glucosidase [Cytophagales bacterium]